MQYNKHNFQKVNDKKIMRKVKKQWVVLSVAAFASLGASAFWMLNPNEVSAHADTISQSVSKDTSNSSVGRSLPTKNTSNPETSNSINLNNIQKVSNNNELKNSKVATQPQSMSNSDKAQNDWNNGKKDSGNNNSDYTNTYNNSTNGFTDAMNNDKKNIIQSQNNNKQTNPNPQNQASGYQNGISQYDQYRSAMNAGASDAYNGSNANTSTQNSTQAKDYYTAAYNGSNDAKTAYNNTTRNEGTDDKSYTSYNQWLTDNNKSKEDKPDNNKANTKAYQQNIDSNFNTSQNTSVKSNNGNIQVTKDSDLNQAVSQKSYQAANKYPDGSAYALSYQYGYNYFLANQGAADAKSGKWNGKNSKGYIPTVSSTNPYDQAYLGAQAAISQQTINTKTGSKGISISNYSGNLKTSIYQSAYNDVANDSRNGVVYIQDSTQMDNILLNNMNGVTSLKLVNDVGYNDLSTQYNTDTDKVNVKNLDIDGQNHILDSGMKSYQINPDKPNTNVNIHNFKTLYGANYYGPFAFNNSSDDNGKPSYPNIKTLSMTYSNVNYVGSKLLSSYYSNVYFNGNVNVEQLDSYSSPFNNSVSTQTDNSYGNGGNYQPGLQVGNMILGSGANYFGSSAIKTGSQNLQVNGNLTLGKNSNMTLEPTGAAEGQDSPDYNNNYGLYLTSSDSSLSLNDGSSLNIFLNRDYGNKVSGIYNNGTINVNNGIINAESDGDFTNGSNQMIVSKGQINITNGGLINVKVSGLRAGSKGLVQNSDNINVSNLGNLSIKDLDNSNSSPVNLINGNPVNIYNVGNQGVTLITNGNPSSKFSTGGIKAYTVVVSTDRDNSDANEYYNFNLNSNNIDAITIDKDGKTNPLKIKSNSLYINNVPSVSFVGPISTTTDNGVTTIHGYAKISKYSNASGNLYIQYAYGNNDNYNSLTQFTGKNYTNQYSSADKNVYYNQVPNDKLNTGDLIPLDLKVPSGINASNYGIRLRYGVSGVNGVTTNDNSKQSYKTNTEGYTSNGVANGLKENDIQSAGGDLASAIDGSADGLFDFQSGSADKKDPTKYQKDLEYTNAYDSAQLGYKYYMDNSSNPSNQENPTVPPIPNNIDNPVAFRKGYFAAVKDLHQGYTESLNGNNINGVPSNADNDGNKYGFAQGQSVLQGIADANKNPNQGSNYSDNNIQNTAYEAAIKAINDGMNNNPMSADDLAKQPRVYQDAYNIAYKNNNDLAKQIAGGNVDLRTLSPAQQVAQKLAQQSMDKAMRDAQTNDHSKDSQYSGNTNADKTYKGAQAGYTNGGTSRNQQDDPVYSNAFNTAQKAAQKAASNGANQYVNGQANNPTENNAAEKSADAYGYQQAKNGYEAAKNKTNDNNSDPSYQAGVKMYSDVNNGINDANNTSNRDDNYQGSTAQKDAYNATLDAVKAGINGEPKLSNLNEKSQAYQDAYNNAYNDSQNKMNEIANNNWKTNGIKLTPAQQKAQQQNQDKISQALSDAKLNDSNKDNNYQGNTNADKVYQATQAGYANGGNNNMTQNQQKDPVYSNAFNTSQKAAQKAASNGANQYVNGQANNPTEDNAAEKSADTYGYQQAKNGYEAAKNGTNDNNSDPSYQAGVKMYSDVNNGINDANNAQSKDPNYAQTHNPAQTSSYNGSFDGIKDGMNNNPYPPANFSQQSQAYQDAYNNARDDAKKKAQEFAQTLDDGGNINEDQLTTAQKQAYDDTKKSINDAINAAAQDNPDNDNKYSGNDNASKAYQAAKDGYANAGNNTINPDKAKDPFYNSAYQVAQKQAQKAANNGVKEFANGANDSSTAGGTDALSKAQNQGYEQAKKGYSDSPIDSNNQDPSYKAGVQMAKDSQTGTKAAYDNPDEGAGYKNGSDAQNDAYAATVAGNTDGASEQPQANMDGKSKVYQDAYNNAYKHANDMAKQAAAGNVDKANLNNTLDQRSYADGVNAAKTGVNAAQENNSDKNNSNYSGNKNADMAYQGAQAGFKAGTEGSNKNPNNSDPVYQKAYNDAYDAARKYAESGAQEFAQGKVNGHTDGSTSAGSNDALSAAQNSGYSQSQKGYNDSAANNVDESNKNPDYLKGIQMQKDAQIGQNYAKTGSGPNEKNSSIAQRDGYSGTMAGANDGASGVNKPDMTGKSKAYKDSYNAAYDNAKDLAAKGAAGVPLDPNQLQNKTDQQAYAKGIDDAKNGYQLAATQNGTDNNNQHHNDDPKNANNLDKAYNGAIDGFNAGANGTDVTNSDDPVYQKAQQSAKQAAQSANETGIQEFMRGANDSSARNNNDPISNAQNKAYDDAKAGYQAQMIGNIDGNNKAPGYLAGVQLAQQASKVANDSNNNPSQEYNDDFSKAVHAATIAGYKDGSHSVTDIKVPDAYQNQTKVYQDAYNVAHQKGIDAAKKGAQSFNDNETKSSGTTAESLAEQQGYQDANDAYDKARETSSLPQSKDGSNYSETYDGAADAFNNAMNGNYNVPENGSDIYKSSYNKALKEAKAIILNAAMNNIKGNSGTNSSLASNTISKLSNLGTTDAAQAYQAALDKSDSYNHSNPNSDDIYKGAQAAFNDIKNGNANTSRNNGNALYQASYDKALTQAQAYAQKGADGYSNGQTPDNPNNMIDNLVKPTQAEKDALNAGYNQAKAGHDDSQNGLQIKQNNPYYLNEFNAKFDTNKGLKDAMNDATKENIHTGDNKLDQAYNGTVDAYTDIFNTSRNINKLPIAYQDAYNISKLQAKNAFQNGANQFNDDQPNDQVNNHGAESIAHNKGYQAAQSIYNQMLQDPNSVDSSNLDPAQQVGYNKAKQAMAGLNDYASGKQPTNFDNEYMSGYNTAKQAVQAAINDVKNGKPMNVNVPNGINPKLYADIYNATYNGYKNGYNGDVINPTQGFAYDIAYKHAYQQGQSDIPFIPTMQNKINSTQKSQPTRNSNKDDNNVVNVDQKTNEGILDAINGHKMRSESILSYKHGYNLGKATLNGMHAAKDGRKGKHHIKSASDSFYMYGYNGYQNGMRAAKRTLKANKRLSKNDLAGKPLAYVYAFKQGLKDEKRHQHNLGTKQGIAMAKKTRAIPTSLAMTHSAQYVESYVKAYKRTMKRNMPKYVYNVRTIFVHKQLKFTNKNRVVRYVKKPRNQSKLLRVTGIAYYKNGTPRYRVVGGGMIADKHGTGIVAANDSIVNAYYRHNFKYFKVIKPNGTLVYKGMKFTKDNVSHKVYHGEIFKVDKVIKYHGLTRFYLGHGHYITSNKIIVKKVI